MLGADDTYRSLHSGDWQPAVNPTKTICDGLMTATGFLTLPTIKQNVSMATGSVYVSGKRFGNWLISDPRYR